MRRATAIMVLVVAAAGPALAAPQARDDAALRAEIATIPRSGMMSVPRADGEFLHDLIAERVDTRALEIGTSNGHSAAWMALVLRKTGGTLVTPRSTSAAPPWRRTISDAWASTTSSSCAAGTP